MLLEKAAFAAIFALASATSAAAGSNCPDVSKQIAGGNNLSQVDGSLALFGARDFVWHVGLPPEGVIRSKDDKYLLVFPTSKSSSKINVDSTAWASVDMDGDGRRDTVLVTDFLQNKPRGEGYYELTSLFIFCSEGGHAQVCARATFYNSPIFTRVMEDGSENSLNSISSFDYKIGPEVRLAILRGKGGSHLIAVLPDKRRRKREKNIADVYAWSGRATSFRLACRLR